MPMTQILRIAILVLAIYSNPVLAEIGDSAAIQNLINARTTAFNARDAGAQAELFSADANFYASDGINKASGRDEIQKLLSIVLDGPLRNATLQQKITNLSFPTNGIAVVTIDVTIQGPSSQGIGTYLNRGIRVMKKVEDQWLISTFINQRVVSTDASILLRETAEK